ncbi:MAG: PqqD family peptide modification chaperone [Anaerolineales bacterium]
MTQADQPVPNPVVVLREEFDDWAVLFNPDTAQAVGLNPVGVAVWKLLDGRSTLGGIADRLAEQFDGVHESVQDELASFAAELAEGGYVGYEMEIAGS